MKVYKVYDDEYSEIMGTEQLREFAFYQLQEYCNIHEEKELEEDIECYEDDLRFIIYYCYDNNILAHELSDIQAIELLKLRNFDVEELNVR